MDRRDFLQVGAAGLALSAASGMAGAAPETKARRVGLIGCGWYGKCDLFRLIQVEPVEVVALCDVDSDMLADAARQVAGRQASKKTPKTYADYRKMLADEKLDIVLVATPDHWHALPMIAAVEAGADVYVQKPISVDVAEGAAMLAAARKHKRVVQVGLQRRSTPHLVEAREEIIKTGKLGKVAMVDICCYWHMRNNSNPPDTNPPKNLDYEMWTGPAPLRPYNEMVHPRSWRAFMAYGNGIVGDMCVHMLDMVRWMIDLGWPKSVSSTGGILVSGKTKSDITDTQEATFDFGDVKVNWIHRTWGSAPDEKYPWSAILYGDKGTLKASFKNYDFVPVGEGKPVSRDVTYELDQYPEDRTEKDLEQHVAPAIRQHMRNFLAAIDARSLPVSDIEQGYISTASCILANLSLQLGRTLHWDPAAGRVVDDLEANLALRRPYRAPWVHPETA